MDLVLWSLVLNCSRDGAQFTVWRDEAAGQSEINQFEHRPAMWSFLLHHDILEGQVTAALRAQCPSQELVRLACIVWQLKR